MPILLGVDVVVMATASLVTIVCTYLGAAVAMVTKEEGIAAIASSAFTGLVMVITYIVMAHVLDMLVMV